MLLIIMDNCVPELSLYTMYNVVCLILENGCNCLVLSHRWMFRHLSGKSNSFNNKALMTKHSWCTQNLFLCLFVVHSHVHCTAQLGYCFCAAGCIYNSLALYIKEQERKWCLKINVTLQMLDMFPCVVIGICLSLMLYELFMVEDNKKLLIFCMVYSVYQTLQLIWQ